MCAILWVLFPKNCKKLNILKQKERKKKTESWGAKESGESRDHSVESVWCVGDETAGCELSLNTERTVIQKTPDLKCRTRLVGVPERLILV